MGDLIYLPFAKIIFTKNKDFVSVKAIKTVILLKLITALESTSSSIQKIVKTDLEDNHALKFVNYVDFKVFITISNFSGKKMIDFANDLVETGKLDNVSFVLKDVT